MKILRVSQLNFEKLFYLMDSAAFILLHGRWKMQRGHYFFETSKIRVDTFTVQVNAR